MADIPSTPADGAVKVVWVPTIANPDAPTVAEVTAVSAVDLSCYLTSDGWTTGSDEQTVSDDRLCDTQNYERPGSSSRTLSLKYVENPGSTTDNKAYTTLTPRTTGFFVVRRGPIYSTALAAGDKVQVWPVQMGIYDWQPPERNSVLRVQQKAFVTGKVRDGVAIVA